MYESQSASFEKQQSPGSEIVLSVWLFMINLYRMRGQKVRNRVSPDTADEQGQARVEGRRKEDIWIWASCRPCSEQLYFPDFQVISFYKGYF